MCKKIENCNWIGQLLSFLSWNYRIQAAALIQYFQFDGFVFFVSLHNKSVGYLNFFGFSGWNFRLVKYWQMSFLFYCFVLFLAADKLNDECEDISQCQHLKHAVCDIPERQNTTIKRCICHSDYVDIEMNCLRKKSKCCIKYCSSNYRIPERDLTIHHRSWGCLISVWIYKLLSSALCVCARFQYGTFRGIFDTHDSSVKNTRQFFGFILYWWLSQIYLFDNCIRALLLYFPSYFYNIRYG